MLLYGFVLLVPMFWLGIRLSQGSLAFSIGEAVGRSLIPMIGVMIYFRWRKPPASVGRFLFSLFTWMFIGQVIGLGYGAARPDLTEKDVPILMREAAGLAPIRQPDHEARKAIRGVYRELLDSSRAYEAEVKALEGPVGESLLQPASFSSPASMQTSLDYLEKMTAVEQRQADALGNFVTRMSAAIDGLNWSQRRKEQFKEGLRSSVERESAIQQRLLQAEIAWFASMTEVYQFALKNYSKITVEAASAEVPEGQLAIYDDRVREEFNQMMDKAEELRKKFLAAQSAFAQNLKANEKKSGVSRKELGLEPVE